MSEAWDDLSPQEQDRLVTFTEMVEDSLPIDYGDEWTPGACIAVVDLIAGIARAEAQATAAVERARCAEIVRGQAERMLVGEVPTRYVLIEAAARIEDPDLTEEREIDG